MISIEDVAQRTDEPLGKYNCKLLWKNGDGFGIVMNELPEEFYMDSLGDRVYFRQSREDETIYFCFKEEKLEPQ